MTAGTAKAQRLWTPLETLVLRREWRPGEDNSLLAARLGRSKSSVKAKASTLGITRPRGFRPWTPREDDVLRELAGRLTDRKIAKKLSRSVVAVRTRAYRIGVSWRDREWYTAQEAAAIMGVDPHWVGKRIQEGTLAAQRNPESGSRDNPQTMTWRIDRKDLRAFIRRYPQELTGRNVDIVQIVDILTGLET